jgi:hypothetical protein
MILPYVAGMQGGYVRGVRPLLARNLVPYCEYSMDVTSASEGGAVSKSNL